MRNLPSFHSIKNLRHRAYNRGAILANLYESHRGKRKYLKPTLEAYLYPFPQSEQNFAEEYMYVHLTERGYKIVS